jgi:outer membrane protein insertion porin family
MLLCAIMMAGATMVGCSTFDHSPQRLAKSQVTSAREAAPSYVAAYPPESSEVGNTTVRGQSPENYSRNPMLPSGAPQVAQQPTYSQPGFPATNPYPQPNYSQPLGAPQYGSTTGNSTPLNGYATQPGYAPQPGYATQGSAPPPGAYNPGAYSNGVNPQLPGFPAAGRPYPVPHDNSAFPGFPDVAPPILDDRPAPPTNVTPLDVYVSETRTGRFMFGVTVNSDAGLGGQITIDERNFDIMNPPRTWDDVLNGTAWRGAGQGFRIEAQPGNRVQRYVISFSDPDLFDTNITFSASAFYFERNYFDYLEDRVGGKVSFGYRLTPNLSSALSLRAEDVKINNPRVAGVAKLDEMLGSTDFYSARLNLVHDTRDHPFLASQGHMLEFAFEQGFGEFSYPRGEVEWRKFFTVRERPDGSGKHTLALSNRVGISGSDTPMFENYFAGGYSSLRGFSFRGASPIDNTVRVGGTFRFLGSAEYFFPITADDMVKGTLFCDYGTVEETTKISNFRVAPGFGFLFNIPALGPAPLAVNFAFPVSYDDTDRKQTFSFFFGATR